MTGTKSRPALDLTLTGRGIRAAASGADHVTADIRVAAAGALDDPDTRIDVAAKGRIHDPVHIVDASLAEMHELLSGGGPSGDELASRFAYRASHTVKDAPRRHYSPRRRIVPY